MESTVVASYDMRRREREKMSEQYSLFFIQRFKGKVLFNVPMCQYTSIGIGGVSDVMAFPLDEKDLADILKFANKKRFETFILGSGTNLLVRDRGIRGIVINMTDGFKGLEFVDEDKIIAGSGISLIKLATKCSEKSLKGMEFAVGIPGTLGGAVIMNAGAYGKEMKDIVEGIEVVNEKGKKDFIPTRDLGFAYRSSQIGKNLIITKVHMKFEKGDKEKIKEAIKGNKEKRKSTSLIKLPNAGSIFKNPENLFTGQIIEEEGLKGLREGDAQISEVHGNYIVNLGRAKAKDVLTLMAIIRDKVFKKRGILLEPEIKVVGED